MKKYRVVLAFSLDKVLFLIGDILYAENTCGPTFRLYNGKTRKTVGTMRESKFKTLLQEEND